MTETLKLLIVEDNPEDIETILRKMESQCPDEFEVHVANCFETALERLREQKFDIVLLDLSLSQLQWTDTYQAIRLIDPNIPIVIMTATEDTAVGTFTIRVGAQDFLVKQYLGEHQLCFSLRFAVERQKHINETRDKDQKLAKAQTQLAEIVSNIKTLLE